MSQFSIVLISHAHETESYRLWRVNVPVKKISLLKFVVIIIYTTYEELFIVNYFRTFTKMKHHGFVNLFGELGFVIIIKSINQPVMRRIQLTFLLNH